jgi:uncharacterized protein YkwD
VLPLWAGTDLAAPTYSGCGGNIAPAINTTYEQEVVERVNDIRTSNGLPALKVAPKLVDAARYFSTDMGQDNYFPDDHGTYDGVGGTSFQCDMGDRIKTFYNWNFVAENIMSGCATAKCAVDWWMGSSGHRANILRDTICETGAGYYDLKGSHSPYATQVLGWQQGVYPVVINGEKTETTSKNVSVTVCVPNLTMAEKFTEMCVSNDGAACTNWVPFDPSFSWTLNGGTGNRTVTVQLRNGATTATSSDTIYLDSSLPPIPGSPMDVHLPMIMKNVGATASPGWQTIVSEDFEGTFPGAWRLSDTGSSGGEYLWARTPCEWYAGSWGGWAVGGGANGLAPSCGSTYPHNVMSWMIYGPFSLADASQADFKAQLWLNLPTDFSDYVFMAASVNGSNFSGYQYADDSGSWGQATLDLANVPTLGDLTGRSAVWIALVFSSDGSVSYADGAHADNIVVRKYVTAAAQSSDMDSAAGAPTLSQGLDTLVGVEAHLHR